MENNYNLERFAIAQNRVIDSVISELKNGKKQSHWMWYIFPQIKELGKTTTSKFYGIFSLGEARAYFNHSTLGPRLKMLCNILMECNESEAENIFGDIDALKLKSSMTLFDIISPNDIFDLVLNKYYEGERCERTLKLL